MSSILGVTMSRIDCLENRTKKQKCLVETIETVRRNKDFLLCKEIIQMKTLQKQQSC